MHQDLITALSQFSASLQQHGTETAAEEGGASGSREKLLEQSVVQQNQIVEMLQKMVASLEAENQSSRERVYSLEHRVHSLSMWKARARLAEERLKEMAESAGVLGSSSAGMISLSAISSFEKALVDKDKMIASLQSQVGGGGGEGGRGALKRVSSMEATSISAKLAAERVRVMELEEELLSSHEESSKARSELADCQSDTMRRESEIQYLRHEIKVVKQVGHQQQDVVMGLRAALLDRDAQISSLTRALERVSEGGRKRWATRNTDSTFSGQSMFDLLLGREVFTVELTRYPKKEELGFSVSRIEMPISSRMSGLIVRTVKNGSPAQGLLLPGDEILEVNGVSCRSASQRKAMESLERGEGSIRIVAAREQGPASFVGRLRSTPVISESSTLWATANDASLLSPSQLSYGSPSLPTSPISPHHYHLTTSPGTTLPHSTGPILPASHTRPQPIGQVKAIESAAHGADKMAAKENASELEEEVQKLREEAEQWQLLQAELEEELDTAHTELEAIKLEHQLTTAENYDLQQQVKSSEAELTDIQSQFGELQQLLEGVREKVGREEERTLSLEQQNAALHQRVAEVKTAQDHDKQRVSEKEEEMLRLKMESEREKSELATKIATLQSRNEQLQADVKQRASQLEAAQAQVREREETLEQERREGQQQLQQLKADLLVLREDSAKAVSSSKIDVEKLQSQTASMKTMLMAAEKKEAEMKIEVRHLRQAADESNKQLGELQESHRNLREQVSSYREQIESKTVECESLTLGLKRAMGKLQANRDLSSRQQREIDKLRRNNARLVVDQVAAEKERGKVAAELRISRSEQAQMREKLQNQGGERDELFSQLESVVAENSALQQQLDDARAALAEATGEKELEQLNRQLEQVQAELVEKREALQEVSGVKEGLESELTLEQSKTAQLKAALASVEATVEGVEAGKKKSDDLVASMSFVHEQDQARLREVEESLSATRGELEKVRVESTSMQSEASTELQQLRSECASLQEGSRGLAAQLDEERAARAGEVEAMKQQLSSSERSASRLQTELEAQQSANSINQATISQLHTTTEQAEEEREKVRKSLQEALQRSHQLQVEVEQLQSHTRELEAENIRLSSERDGLSEDAADLRLSLKQASAQVDTLTAKLQATEVSLAIAQQSLEEGALKEREMKARTSELAGKLSEQEKQLATAKSRAQEVTLSLHSREEKISQLKAQLELSQTEHNQLQSSFTALQTATKSRDKRVKSLEMERANLRVSVEQLEAAQEGLKGAVTALEREKAYSTENQLQEVESLTQQIEENVATEKDHLGKIRRLEMLHSEAQSTVEQLLAAQEALKSSVTALGDEKEGEVVRLREEMVKLEGHVVSSQQRASQAGSRAEELQTQLQEAIASGQASSERLGELQEENEHLREEVGELRTTKTQLLELHTKVDLLDETQRERSSKVVVLQGQLEEATRELQAARAENETMLGKVGEMAAMTVSLAEKSAELDKVKGDLVVEVKGRQEAVDEKDQLLGVLRRLEVEKHTVAMTTQPESPTALLEADREQLLQATRDKEEEAMRLREYVGKLLSAVVERAPFILERME